MNKIKLAFIIIVLTTVSCWAVTSQIVKHSKTDDFSAGEFENTVLNSNGNISLSCDSKTLAENFDSSEVWLFNSAVKAKDGSIYAASSPNGKIFKYKNGKTECIWPVEIVPAAQHNDANTVPTQKHTDNLHIFALGFDSKDKLLAAVSGDECKLMRYDGKNFETVFEPNEITYIFAITTDAAGNIYLGTGPEGRIFKLDKKLEKAELLYSCTDKNILSLATDSKVLYAGSDGRGVIYKIDIAEKTAAILYDSRQDEITSLLIGNDGNLYASAASYKSIRAQMQMAGASRNQLSSSSEQNDEQPESMKFLADLEIVNTGQANGEKPENQMPDFLKHKKSSAVSCVYKITPDGFATEIFSETAVFFSLAGDENKIFVGTGNKAELYSIDVEKQISTMIYKDKNASQITGIVNCGNDTLLACTANPAKIIMLSSEFAKSGSFQSVLIDAAQPAKWGKLQIEATVPQNCKIKFSARSGNVEDVNDPTYSSWTEPAILDYPKDLVIPAGRFCEYKLILQGNGKQTPTIRQVAAAYMVANLAPQVKQISIVRAAQKDNPSAIMNIKFSAEDKNNDSLIYEIDFRKKNADRWIELTDELDKPEFEFDGRTLEDGIYEIQITASDKMNNNSANVLTGTKISEPFVIDNTPPEITKSDLQIEKDVAVLKLQTADEYSIVSALSYTVDSNKKWFTVLPDDSIFDTKQENFVIQTETLEKGNHIIAVRLADIEGNTMYKTFEAEVK